jgi:hypothetical protein
MTGIMEEAAIAAGVTGEARAELIERVRNELRPAIVTEIAEALHDAVMCDQD